MKVNYTVLFLLFMVVVLLIALGFLDIHALFNDVITGVLSGAVGAYVIYKLISKRRRK